MVASTTDEIRSALSAAGLDATLTVVPATLEERMLLLDRSPADDPASSGL
ncbi:hypothetical protein ATK17_0972 [Branchiibius hedensis]|uniref:Uncharacterized protein n=1 Tax=Branchiibius hedensis TaxID=672460 RepID=A0A2Y8ZUY5_9MICO|nr:hypothetical protein [Branchiibius hedensis]PWJ24871.1 hypothetical protein ATK17_0972 [Branchiibius hedensis]SSA33687.1 hypothetical protein SAMN04489750_0972 [Branchiibius hedensis]